MATAAMGENVIAINARLISNRLRWAADPRAREFEAAMNAGTLTAPLLGNPLAAKEFTYCGTCIGDCDETRP
jgi:hypothetical protein